MDMKRHVAIVLLALAAVFCGGLHAQEADDTLVSATSIVERINASGHIVVNHPAALELRLRKDEDAAQTETVDVRATQQGRVGYRIQVFDDNNPRTARTEAQNRKRLMESRFPEWRSYMQFNSPYWRVKVGDFQTRGEAEGAIEDMRRAFPYMSTQLRIVRDRINIVD